MYSSVKMDGLKAVILKAYSFATNGLENVNLVFFCVCIVANYFLLF